MKEKKEWNIFYDDFNRRKISTFNIFDHYKFSEDCDKAWIEYKDNINSFKNEIDKNLFYYFNSKCEWEIIITSIIGRENFKESKIDVYTQIKINFDRFIEYLVKWYSENYCKKKVKKI